jgi:hypothetical protein
MESSTERRRGASTAGPDTVLAMIFGIDALAVSLELIRALWPFTVDDTFITLRYARNLAERAPAGMQP